MATVNFSVPEEVKNAFNAAFADCNKSAVISNLMTRAVEEAAVRKKREAAMKRLLSRRSARPPVSDADIRSARESVRS